MSEYIEINTEDGDDDNSLYIFTNLRLTEGTIEAYRSTVEMELGSAVAQALSVVEGLQFVRIEDGELFIVREPGTDWHGIVDDISAVLKDFFL